MNYPPSELGMTICRICYDRRVCICHVDRQQELTVDISVNVRHKAIVLYQVSLHIDVKTRSYADV